jgi:hypothetical protein
LPLPCRSVVLVLVSSGGFLSADPSPQQPCRLPIDQRPEAIVASTRPGILCVYLTKRLPAASQIIVQVNLSDTPGRRPWPLPFGSRSCPAPDCNSGCAFRPLNSTAGPETRATGGETLRVRLVGWWGLSETREACRQHTIAQHSHELRDRPQREGKQKDSPLSVIMNEAFGIHARNFSSAMGCKILHFLFDDA